MGKPAPLSGKMDVFLCKTDSYNFVWAGVAQMIDFEGKSAILVGVVGVLMPEICPPPANARKTGCESMGCEGTVES